MSGQDQWEEEESTERTSGRTTSSKDWHRTWHHPTGEGTGAGPWREVHTKIRGAKGRQHRGSPCDPDRTGTCAIHRNRRRGRPAF
eukprot:1383865-Alexandrium_andersonii.AAC.1